MISTPQHSFTLTRSFEFAPLPGGMSFKSWKGRFRSDGMGLLVRNVSRLEGTPRSVIPYGIHFG